MRLTDGWPIQAFFWLVWGTGNQVSEFTPGSVQHDASGDVTYDGRNSYLYNAEGQICAVSNTYNSITTMIGYVYDADGQRVAKGTITTFSCDVTTNGFQTQSAYVRDQAGNQLSEFTPGSGGSMVLAHTNVWANGALIATDDVNRTHFYLNDWLGTRRVQTDDAGNLEQNCASLPYGDGETCGPAPTENLYTGKERDTESGNDYFGARYYASTMGRFLSPDPLFIAAHRIADPQLWNLYQYARDNPLLLTDSTGLDIKLDCSRVSASSCSGVVNDLNNRKGAEFSVSRNSRTGLLEVDGKVDASKLSKGESALYSAITDTGHHATLSLVNQSDTVQFGRFEGNGHNTIDVSDLNLLNKASPEAAGETVAHEGLEAYGSSFGNGSNYLEWHGYANQFFGQVTNGPENLTLAPQGSSFYTQDWNFHRIGADLQVTTVITPQPAQTVPQVYTPGRIIDVEPANPNQ